MYDTDHLYDEEWAALNAEVAAARERLAYYRAKTDAAEAEYRNKIDDLTSLGIRIRFRRKKKEQA